MSNSTEEELIKLCTDYQRHLEKSITRLTWKMPREIVNDYLTMGQVNINKLINQKNSGLSFYIRHPKHQINVHSSQIHPQLYDALNKYEVVQKMLHELKTGDQNTRIERMHMCLTLDNKAILVKRRDSSKGSQFLEKVMHLLTLGVYSALTKNTFPFGNLMAK